MIPQPQEFKGKPEKLPLSVAATLGSPGLPFLTLSLHVGEPEGQEPEPVKENQKTNTSI